MKKTILSLLAVIFLLAGATPAQTPRSDKSSPGKIVSLSGKLSEDGKSFLAKHGQLWAIVNPEAVSGQVGHELKLKCQILAASREIQVIAVKVVATQVRLAPNPGDAAFRR